VFFNTLPMRRAIHFHARQLLCTFITRGCNSALQAIWKIFRLMMRWHRDEIGAITDMTGAGKPAYGEQ
jgi:hypothetical protein